jgi:hypothetical protein
MKDHIVNATGTTYLETSSILLHSFIGPVIVSGEDHTADTCFCPSFRALLQLMDQSYSFCVIRE